MKKIGAREWVYEWPTPQEEKVFENLLHLNQMLALAFGSLKRKTDAALKKNL